MISFFVPGRPVPKQSARFGRGKSWQPKKKVAYKRLIETVSRNAWLAAGKPDVPPPYCVRLEFVFAWPKATQKALRSTVAWRVERPDLDNLTKMVLDGIHAKIISDDATVTKLILTKKTGPSDQEGVTVTITGVEPDETDDERL